MTAGQMDRKFSLSHWIYSKQRTFLKAQLNFQFIWEKYIFGPLNQKVCKTLQFVFHQVQKPESCQDTVHCGYSLCASSNLFVDVWLSQLSALLISEFLLCRGHIRSLKWDHCYSMPKWDVGRTHPFCLGCACVRKKTH